MPSNLRRLLVAATLVVAGGTLRAETPEPRLFVEVTVPSLEAARTLALEGFDVAGIDRKALAVGLVVTEQELADLQAKGFAVTVRGSNVEPSATRALADYTDPQEMSAFMDQVVAAYPNLAEKSISQSPLFEGQTQYVLHLTKDVGLANERPSFVLDAQHHAREVMTPEIARDMIDYLTSRYATDPQVQRWLDSINIYVVGSVNPDGAMYVFTTDTSWRKNRHPSCAVDNNRNYPVQWGSCNGSSASCSAQDTRGSAPGSEPETQGLMQLTAQVRPFFALSYHSYGEYLMYSYGCNDPDERAALDEVAQGLNAILLNDSGVPGQYATGPIWSTIYLADGGSVDTQYNQYGAYAYVIEVNSSAAGGFQPSYASWRNLTVQRQRTAWQYFLDETLDGAQIRGKVTDAQTGLPLSANLELQEVTFTHGEAPRRADAKGNYRLLVQSGQTYHVRYSSPGYCTATREVAVGSGPQTADVTLGQPGVPQGVTAAPAGDSAIDVSWQPAANAVTYHVYRALDPGGAFALVAEVPGAQTSYHDAPVSGGVTYRYLVRAVQGCESADSAVAQATTTGPCTVGPSFAGAMGVADSAASTCTLHLFWPSAVTRCGGAVTYTVHRSATTPFLPSPANVVASGLTSNFLNDQAGLTSATPYAYIVRAVDGGNGADDGNLVTVSATPTGPPTVGTWTDTAGDSGPAAMALANPWSVKPTGGRSAPGVYATGTYGNNVCAALTTPALTVQSGASLSFASKYDMETSFDLGIVEIATGSSNYTDWTKLALNYPADSIAFTGNACGIPTSTGAVFSRTIATPAYPASPYTGSLAAYAGQSVKVRWRFSSDGGVTGQGWWIDDVSVSNAVIPGTCATGTAPNPKEVSASGGMTASRTASGAIDVLYTPACGATDNAVFWGTGTFPGHPAWTGVACAVGNTGHAVFDPGALAPGTLLYFAVVGQNATREGSYGAGTAGQRPEAVNVGACDRPQDLSGSCP
ncbi:MAG TPA: M14 family zinc carboxypeptidase [Candidatus Polarisedimenticolaceae bacterium]|nr:M14 family zinc carboxypeptidase [Candidatus Polarisedimenticolaceae bacterium]